MSIKKTCICDMCETEKNSCDVYGFDKQQKMQPVIKTAMVLSADKHICKSCYDVIYRTVSAEVIVKS